MCPYKWLLASGLIVSDHLKHWAMDSFYLYLWSEACVARGERWCCQQEQHRPGEVLISILYTSGHSGCDASLPYVHMGVTCCMSWGQLDGFDLCELWFAWCFKMLLSSIISGTSCSLGLFSSPTADRSWGNLSFELCGL